MTIIHRKFTARFSRAFSLLVNCVRVLSEQFKTQADKRESFKCQLHLLMLK